MFGSSAAIVLATTTNEMLVFSAGLLGLILLPLAVSVWIYRDARERGQPNAVLWAVAAFSTVFGSLVVYALYVSVRDDADE